MKLNRSKHARLLFYSDHKLDSGRMEVKGYNSITRSYCINTNKATGYQAPGIFYIHTRFNI